MKPTNKVIPFNYKNRVTYQGRSYVACNANPCGTRLLMAYVKRHGLNKPMHARHSWRKTMGCPLVVYLVEAFIPLQSQAFMAMVESNKARLIRDRFKRALDWNNGVVSNEMRRSFPPALWGGPPAARKAYVSKSAILVAHVNDNQSREEMERMIADM